MERRETEAKRGREGTATVNDGIANTDKKKNQPVDISRFARIFSLVSLPDIIEKKKHRNTNTR